MKIVLGNTRSRIYMGTTSPKVLKKLRSYMKVRGENYQYSKAFKRRAWDGYNHFVTESGWFATGFLQIVCNFLMEEFDIIPQIVDERDNQVVVPSNFDYDLIEGISAFPYQRKVIKSIDKTIIVGEQVIPFNRGIWDCATNSGKTVMAAILMNNFPEGTNILFLVNGQDLFDQSLETFREYLPHRDIGFIEGSKINIHDITITKQQTLFNRLKTHSEVKEYLNNMNVLIVDESDEAGANTYVKVIQQTNAYVTLFISGTPLDSGVLNKMNAVGMSGRVLKKVTNKYLVEKGYSQNPLINIVWNNYVPDRRAFTYPMEKEVGINQCQQRLKRVLEILEVHRGQQILITFLNIEHGEFMYEGIQSYFGEGYDVSLVHANTKKIPTKERKRIIKEFKEGKIEVLVASLIVKRGINAKGIRVLIAAHGGKDKTTLKQVLGRGLRNDGINEDVYIYDFFDNGKYLAKHSRKRIKQYEDEGFPVKLWYTTYRRNPKEVIPLKLT